MAVSIPDIPMPAPRSKFFQGNYIILDDEDLLDDEENLEREGGDGTHKKPSFTEKLMAVKNAQNESQLAKTKQHLTQEIGRQLRLMHEETTKIRYEYKVMQVDRKQNELEVRQRKNPDAEMTYDDLMTSQSAQYLKYDPTNCFYLQRKNMHRATRTNSNPETITPAVAKARRILQERAVQSQIDEQNQHRYGKSVHFSDVRSCRSELSDGSPTDFEISGEKPRKERTKSESHSAGVSRGHKARTVSDSVLLTNVSDLKLPKFNSTKSNPPSPRQTMKDHVKHGQVNSNSHENKSFTPLKQSMRLKGEKKNLQFPTIMPNSMAFLRKALNLESEAGAEMHTVKPLPKVGEGLEDAESADDDVDIGTETKPDKLFTKTDKFSAQDELDQPDHGQVSRSWEMGRPHTQAVPYRSPSVKSTTKRPLTQETLRQEAATIQSKLDKFFRSIEIAKEKERQRVNDNKDRGKDKKGTDKSTHLGTQSWAKSEETSKMSASTQSQGVRNKWKRSIANVLMSQRATKKEDTEIVQISQLTEPNNGVHPMYERKTSTTSMSSDNSSQARRSLLDLQERRGSVGVPNNAAFRSKRHTATFKLARVVETLMAQKTRYELMEIAKAKKQLDIENPGLGVIPETMPANN